MEGQDQLTLARDLVEALEAGERGSADRIVNALAQGLESSVCSQVATMTEELRKALADLEGDVGVAGMTLHEIPSKAGPSAWGRGRAGTVGRGARSAVACLDLPVA